MVDTHAHLNFPQLLSQIDKVIEESQRAGLTAIIIASSNLEDSKNAVKLARKYPKFLFASVGIHPQKTDSENKMPIKLQLSQLDQLISQNRQMVVAIGETGMDYDRVPPNEEERSKEGQEELFLDQIELALKYRLPLIIHAREANDEVIDLISSWDREIVNSKIVPRGSCFAGKIENCLCGVFHCYSGGKKRIQKVLNLPGKWYFGFDGNLTYDQGLGGVVSLIPKGRLLLETDAPFLAPEPYRGQINTPALLPLIAKKVAAIWQVNLEEVIRQTTDNTKELFKL